MRKLILLLVLVVALSGCVNQTMVLKYKNDIITVEDYSVSSLSPYTGSATALEFSIKNNGDKTVNKVEVNFFDRPGFAVKELFCEGIEEWKFGSGTNCESDIDCINNEFCDFSTKKCYKGCLFTNVESLDFRTIRLTLSPTSTGTSTISYSIKYNYSGFRKADIPVIDGITRKQPISKFSQSIPTYGPVVISFEPPVGRERKENNKIIKEYWIVGDIPFELRMKLKHVGSKSVGDITPVTIPAGNMKIDLRGTLVVAKSETTELPCDFYESNGFLFSGKDVELPGELVCNFQSVPLEGPETLATIWAEFFYTYKYVRTETFNVKALPEE